MPIHNLVFFGTDISMKDATSVLGHQFGQRRPPLSVTIKAILDRYPDGQIFKVKYDIVASPDSETYIHNSAVVITGIHICDHTVCL